MDHIAVGDYRIVYSMQNTRQIVILALVALVMACSQEEPGTAAPSSVPGLAGESAGGQHFDPGRLARGAELYREHCAQCHGPQGQGHPDWLTPSDGSYAAAPPLNGTGNDWKRSRAELIAAIRNGAQRKDGTEIMPRWKGRMSDEEMDDIVSWCQSLWAPDVYARWLRSQVVAGPSG